MPRAKAYVQLLASYPDSEKINALDARWAEPLYTRLIARCDDAGRFIGSPHRVLAKLFGPLWERGKITVEDVAEAITDLERVGLVQTYSVGGVAHLLVRDFFRHIRSGREPIVVYPAPENGPGDSENAFGSQMAAKPEQNGDVSGAFGSPRFQVPGSKCQTQVPSARDARTPAREPDPPGGEAGQPDSRPDPAPDPNADPHAWDCGSEPKNAAWADWLAHLREQERPPTQRTLSRHWHRLLAWTDEQAVAVVSAAIELGARAWTDGIVARALEAVARGKGQPGSSTLRLAEHWTLPEALGGEDFRPSWSEWLKHKSGMAGETTEAQLRAHLDDLARAGLDGARRAIAFAISHGHTGFSERVLELAAAPRGGSVLAGPGSPKRGLTPEELRRLGWSDDGIEDGAQEAQQA